MSNFDIALRHVLVHEGGYVNDKNDPGGETNFGITRATARAHGYTGSMRSIPMSTVRAIYRKGFWDTIKGDELPAGVDFAVFDFCVNSGPGRAIPFLQRAVGVPSDGRIGPTTLAAVARKGPETVIRDLCRSRLAWLKTLKTWRFYGRGWSRRVTAVERDALSMIRAARLLPVDSDEVRLLPQPESAITPAPTPARNWFLS
jgi:lysozyme family protein